MKRTIVGLHGTVGAGKDSVADHMTRNHGFHKIAFADAVKDDLISMFDVFPRVFYERQSKEVATDLLSFSRLSPGNGEFLDWYIATANGELEAASLGAGLLRLPRSPRWLTQTYGTDYRRVSDENYWINRLADKIAELPIETNVVISDVRFINEAYFIKNESDVNEVWEVIRMNNPHHNKNDRHASNVRLPSVDKVLFNSGTINQLWRKVDRAVEKVL